MTDAVMVRWESDGGWREGVLLCCALDIRGAVTSAHAMRYEIARGSFGTAVIYAPHRNERAIVPLGKMRLVEPRCPKCDGEGVVDAVATTGNGQGAAYRCKTTCECQQAKPRPGIPRCPKCDAEGTVLVRDASGTALKFCECRKT